MIRVPNASPSGFITNFETKCSEYFHPNVLVYILRNRTSYLSRNRYILKSNFGLSNYGFNHGISSHHDQLHILPNSYVNNYLISDGVSSISKNLNDELMQLSFSIISCCSCLHPQSASTILLSFIKLNCYNEDLFSSLVNNYNFLEANNKSVSLLVYSLSKHPICSDLVSHNFIQKVEDFISKNISYSSCQDLTTYLISLSKIKESCSKNTFRNPYIIQSLINIYNILLNRTISILERDKINNIEYYEYNEKEHKGNNIDKDNELSIKELEYELNAPNETTDHNTITENNFSTFELSNILESLYIMKHYNPDDHNIILKHLTNNLPKSINYISDSIYIMKLFNINPKTTSINKSDRVNLIRLNKKFSENILVDITDKLDLLSIKELSQFAENINKLRLWADDKFFKSYTKSFMSKFQKEKHAINFNTILPIIVYFNKRYESCINREYYYSQNNESENHESKLLSMNEISDLCGYVCETLNEFVNKMYPNKTIDNKLRFTGKLRTNRNLHLMKYNYKLP